MVQICCVLYSIEILLVKNFAVPIFEPTIFKLVLFLPQYPPLWLRSGLTSWVPSGRQHSGGPVSYHMGLGKQSESLYIQKEKARTALLTTPPPDPPLPGAYSNCLFYNKNNWQQWLTR